MFKNKSAKTVKQKICIRKTNTFTIIAMNFVQEQLKSAKEYNIAGQVVRHFKEFLLTKQNTRPRTDYEWSRKTIYKESDPEKMKKCRMLTINN